MAKSSPNLWTHLFFIITSIYLLDYVTCTPSQECRNNCITTLENYVKNRLSGIPQE